MVTSNKTKRDYNRIWIERMVAEKKQGIPEKVA